MTRERRPAALALQAPAKVNLFLEVLGKRPDGYHDLETLMVAVDLTDTLEFWPDESGALTLTCDAPGLTTGPGNLVLCAANSLKRHAKYAGGAPLCGSCHGPARRRGPGLRGTGLGPRALHHHSEPQSAGPPPGLPNDRDPARAGGHGNPRGR